MIELEIDEVDKVIIEDAFRGKINLENMSFGVAEELAEILSDINNDKEADCRLVKEHPIMTSYLLRTFGKYVKQEAKKFNEEYGKEVKFSGLLGRYMREIKNASKGATQ